MSERVAGALRATVLDPRGEEREAVVLRVTGDDGVTGWGEGSPLPDYSPDSLDDVEAGLDEWAVRWSAARGAGTGAGSGADAGIEADFLADLPAARCAIDTALLDAEARRRGAPLHAVLLESGTAARAPTRVPVAALVSLAGVERSGVPQGTVASDAPRGGAASGALGEVAELAGVGYRTVKLKLGARGDSDEGYAAELAELEAIRAAFPYLRLRLDVNGRWSPERARPRIAELERALDPELIEQPVGPEELLGFGHVPVPLAADESLRLPGALEELATPGGCGFLVLKPMVLGGLGPCLRLALAGFEHGMQAIVSHTFGGAVAHASACELAIALAAMDPATAPPAAGLAGHDELPQRAGAWIVPAAVAGHGVEAPW